MPGLPPVFIEFLGSAKGVKMAAADAKVALAEADAAGAGAFQKSGMLGKAAIAGLGVAAFEAGKKAVEAAMSFQTQMTRVRTGAGEAQANMAQVSQGVLSMAGAVGQTTEHLTAGLYNVESAGFRGGAALEVLKDSAEGAKVGAAELSTVADAVTTGLNAYSLGADHAAEVTNALIATEASGKTNMEDLAASMSSILPAASAAHVGLQEILAAMATITAQGTPAANAATYLRQTIGALSNPSGKAAQEMKSLGLDAVQVGQSLGKNGLAATLETLTNAITQRMGPAGTVLIEHLRKASQNTSEYQKVLAGLGPDQQTYIGALATMVGGTKSMQAALQLTGPHMATFKANIQGIAEHVKDAHGEIEGWADVQANTSQKIDSAKASAGALAIQIGQYLLPVVDKIAGAFAVAAEWITKHQQVAKVLAFVIGGVLVVALAMLAAGLYAVAAAAAVNPVTWIILGVVALIAMIVMLVMQWRTVWDWIKGAATAVSHAIADAWHWLASETSSVWGGIVDWVTGAWHSLAGFFTSAWHFVVDPLVAAWNWVASVTSTVWGAISGFFMKWWPLLLLIFMTPIAIIMAIWNHFHTAITNTATTVWNAISAFFSTVWGGIVAVAQAVWGAIRAVIVDPIVWVWHQLVSIWGAVSSWLGQAWGEIKHLASLTWLGIKLSIINPVMEIWHQVTSIFDRVSTAIGSALNRAWNAVKDIGSKFLSVGRDIVMGIIHGIEHAGGALFDSLGNLAHDALNSAKSFLGINSPSKVFADHVGRSIPEGIAAGIQAHAAHATDAVTSLAGQVLGAGRLGGGLGLGLAGGGSLALPAGGGGTGGSQVVNHFHIAGSLLAERQLIDLVRQGNLRDAGRNPSTYPEYKR
jgi:TP901 family phage tail tape measure protein